MACRDRLISRILCTTSLALLLTGCLNNYNFLHHVFPQAERVVVKEAAILPWRKTAMIYDQFERKAILTALLHSPQLAYIEGELECLRTGLEGLPADTKLNKLVTAAQTKLRFSVVLHTVDQVATHLTDPNASWALSIELSDGTRLQPASLRETDLSPEAITLMKSSYTPFALSYIVEFPLNGIQLAEGEIVTLHFADSVFSGKVAFTWSNKVVDAHAELFNFTPSQPTSPFVKKAAEEGASLYF